MPRALEVDGAGIRAASLAEIREDLNDRQLASFGSDLVLSEQVPQSQWSGILALALTEILEGVVRTAIYGSSVDHAPSTWLDQLGSLAGIDRVQATRSRVTATLTGVAGTGVPSGSRARTPAGALFESLGAVALSPSGVDVEFLAILEGPIEAAAGTLTEIVSVIAGWETVTNAEAAALGRARQTDAEYREAFLARTARVSVGSMSALEGALAEALAGKARVLENATTAAVTVQEWPLPAHSILVVAETGIVSDIQRAVETHRGMGVATSVGIVSGTPDEGDLDAVTAGTVTWDGVNYTGLDLTGGLTRAEKAAALTALLAAAGVTIVAIDDRYVAIFEWVPTDTPNFEDGTTEVAFGFDPASSNYPPGPFIRTRARELAVDLDVTRQPGFPADGLTQIRTNVTAIVDAYGVGEQVWSNDILRVAEGVQGTRVTTITVQYAGVDASGVAVPLDILWSLPIANLTITIT